MIYTLNFSKKALKELAKVNEPIIQTSNMQ